MIKYIKLSISNKHKFLMHIIFWIGFLVIHVISTKFLNDKFRFPDIIKIGLLYSASGFLYSFLCYTLIKYAKSKITKGYLFIISIVFLIYIITYTWNITQHFAWWLILGENDFSAQHYLYAFKSFKSSIFIIASLFALVISEKNIQGSSEKRVTQTLDLYNVKDLINKRELSYNETIFIPDRDKIANIKLSSIKIIKANDYYSNIILENDNKTIVSKYSLKKWEQELPEKHFIRIHRSTIININFISSIDRMSNDIYKVTIIGCNESLSISRRRGKYILDNYQL